MAVSKVEQDNKQKALQAAIDQINKQFGKGSIMRLGDNKQMDIESIPTGGRAVRSLMLNMRLILFTPQSLV